MESEPGQDALEGFGEFADGHAFAAEFVAEIVEHGFGRVLDQFRIHLPIRVANQFDGGDLGRAGERVPGIHIEKQAIGA